MRSQKCCLTFFKRNATHSFLTPLQTIKCCRVQDELFDIYTNSKWLNGGGEDKQTTFKRPLTLFSESDSGSFTSLPSY